MAKRKLQELLIDESQIQEEMRLIEGSINDYVTPSGNIYTKYSDTEYYHKSTFINKNNGYLYANLNGKDGKTFQRRVHRLVAIAYIPNPDNLPIVMHLDNNKANPMVTNLKWGTGSENTKDAFDNGLAKNDKGFKDSQSMPIAVFDLNKDFIKSYGSVSIAAQEMQITKTGILYQCKHKIKTKPRCGYYFRFLDEYMNKGFIL